MLTAMPTRRRFLAAALGTPLFPTATRAAVLEGSWTVETVDGETRTADRLNLDGGDLLPGLPLDGVSVVARDAPILWDPRRPWVESVAGDRLFGRCRAFDGVAFLFEPASAPPNTTLSLPAETVRAVKPADRVPLDEEVLPRLLRTRGEEDLIVRPTGVERGTLLAIDADAVTVAGAAGDVRFPRSAVRAVALAPALLARPPAEPGRFGVLLADGSWFRADDVDEAGNRFTFGTVVGPLSVDAADVARIASDGPRIRPFTVDRYEHVPFLGDPVPFRHDRTIAGTVCVAGGRPRPWGVGVPSGSTLSGTVPASAQEFAVTLAVHAAAGPRADVTVRVSVDDAVLFEAIAIGADGVRDVRVRVDGAESITLSVGHGRNGDVRDLAFWARPRFVS